MTKFWELMSESVITQALITVMVLGVWIAMLIIGKPIPELLNTLVAVVVSFFFGSKMGMAQGEKKASKPKKDDNAPVL